MTAHIVPRTDAGHSEGRRMDDRAQTEFREGPGYCCQRFAEGEWLHYQLVAPATYAEVGPCDAVGCLTGS